MQLPIFGGGGSSCTHSTLGTLTLPPKIFGCLLVAYLQDFSNDEHEVGTISPKMRFLIHHYHRLKNLPYICTDILS